MAWRTPRRRAGSRIIMSRHARPARERVTLLSLSGRWRVTQQLSRLSRRKGGDGASKTLLARLLHARKNKQPLVESRGSREREREIDRKRANWTAACRVEACARAEERKFSESGKECEERTVEKRERVWNREIESKRERERKKCNIYAYKLKHALRTAKTSLFI